MTRVVDARLAGWVDRGVTRRAEGERTAGEGDPMEDRDPMDDGDPMGDGVPVEDGGCAVTPPEEREERGS
jgi:hypothetical protein